MWVVGSNRVWPPLDCDSARTSSEMAYANREKAPSAHAPIRSFLAEITEAAKDGPVSSAALTLQQALFLLSEFPASNWVKLVYLRLVGNSTTPSAARSCSFSGSLKKHYNTIGESGEAKGGSRKLVTSLRNNNFLVMAELQAEPVITACMPEGKHQKDDNVFTVNEGVMVFYRGTEIPDDYPDQFDDVLEFIQDTIKRLRRSSNKQPPSRRDRGRQSLAANTQISSKKTVKDRKRKNKGCVLREIHLNVTDLGLGYETKEELKFRYCSGSCNNPETTYDQILKNLTIRKKLVNDKVKQACCRPIAFDDDLSFLDDNLVYHTLKQHSAKKCGCI
ncbi:hypothetical protein XELAEV_18008351mg [Xenopus laevis]|uniref:Glial cell line-derived neurotrophic factor n=1 Tax=Xenopus laevis TaxID=8355 RepID=A0A974I603_XENLA|nr:hypothetical protein XELAEV_18008351mg [Xenopus laevis]